MKIEFSDDLKENLKAIFIACTIIIVAILLMYINTSYFNLDTTFSDDVFFLLANIFILAIEVIILFILFMLFFYLKDNITIKR